MNRILQSMVNPDALRKKAIRLACERCDKVMKSVVGYVSHVRFCQKKVKFLSKYDDFHYYLCANEMYFYARLYRTKLDCLKNANYARGH